MKKALTAILTAAVAASALGLMACGGGNTAGGNDTDGEGVKTYTFEAEGVDFTGLAGHGYSLNVEETGLIKGKRDNIDSKVLASASNGYFVGDFNNPDSSLTFNITADKASEDNVIVLRLASEYGSMELTPDIFEVEVNGTKLAYTKFKVTGGKVSGTSDIKYQAPFADFTLSSKFALKAGENTVKLTVRKNTLGLANTLVESVSPGIDCIKIKSQSKLTWESNWEENKEIASITD